MDTLFICLSFLSLSAVLASITVTLRNFAFSAVLQPGVINYRIGDKDYEDILTKSGLIATIAGIVFIINTFFALYIGWQCITSEQNTLYPFQMLSPLLVVGMVLFLICLIFGYVQFNLPKRDKTIETPKQK